MAQGTSGSEADKHTELTKQFNEERFGPFESDRVTEHEGDHCATREIL